MGVYLRDKVWPSGIPYECTDAWAIARIEDFNQRVRIPIFRQRAAEVDYVVFVASGGSASAHGQCQIGRAGGRQTLNFVPGDQRVLWHEMGHCCGLGHEQYHPQWPFRQAMKDKPPNDVHKIAYNSLAKKYSSVRSFDPQSIMLYPNDKFFKANDKYFEAHDVTKQRPLSIPLSQALPTVLSANDVQLLSLLYGGVDIES